MGELRAAGVRERRGVPPHGRAHMGRRARGGVGREEREGARAGGAGRGMVLYEAKRRPGPGGAARLIVVAKSRTASLPGATLLDAITAPALPTRPSRPLSTAFDAI